MRTVISLSCFTNSLMASKFLILILKAPPVLLVNMAWNSKRAKKKEKNKRTLDVARRKESEIFPAKFQ